MQIIRRLGFILLFFLVLTAPANADGLFTDVSETEWTYPAIAKLVETKVIQGYGDGTFRPNYAVTRAQSAVFIGRALELDLRNITNPNFQDITPESFGYSYIAKLTELGVFSKSSKFNPGQALSRAEMAKILALGFDLIGQPTNRFEDVSRSSFAYPYIGQLVEAGITTGTTATTFSPDQLVNRQQLSLFIYRAKYPEAPVVPPMSATDPSFAKGKELLNMVNAARDQNGLSVLQYDKAVENVAMLKARDMRDNNYFAHRSPTYGDPHEMLTRFGVKWTASGENIAAGYQSAGAVHEGWMNSPGHRANILNSKFTHVGFGYVEGGTNYKGYWVQMFIRK